MNLEKYNTRLSAEAIQKMVAGNSLRRLESGGFVLPPARISFVNLAEPGAPAKNNPNGAGKFGVNLLFPFAVDHALIAPFRTARFETLAKAFPNNPQGVGMKDPFKNADGWVSPKEGGKNVQGKSYAGYVPGLLVISATSQRRPGLWKPPFVNGEPTAVVTAEEIKSVFYPGAWVVPCCNLYVSKVAENPGVFVGLQSLFKLADDNTIGGGGAAQVDPKAAFGGIQIDNSVDASTLF